MGIFKKFGKKILYLEKMNSASKSSSGISSSGIDSEEERILSAQHNNDHGFFSSDSSFDADLDANDGDGDDDDDDSGGGIGVLRPPGGNRSGNRGASPSLKLGGPTALVGFDIVEDAEPPGWGQLRPIPIFTDAGQMSLPLRPGGNRRASHVPGLDLLMADIHLIHKNLDRSHRIATASSSPTRTAHVDDDGGEEEIGHTNIGANVSSGSSGVDPNEAKRMVSLDTHETEGSNNGDVEKVDDDKDDGAFSRSSGIDPDEAKRMFRLDTRDTYSSSISNHNDSVVGLDLLRSSDETVSAVFVTTRDQRSKSGADLIIDEMRRSDLDGHLFTGHELGATAAADEEKNIIKLDQIEGKVEPTFTSVQANLAELHESMTFGRTRPKTPLLSSASSSSDAASEDLTLSALSTGSRQQANKAALSKGPQGARPTQVGDPRSIDERLASIEGMCKSILFQLGRKPSGDDLDQDPRLVLPHHHRENSPPSPTISAPIIPSPATLEYDAAMAVLRAKRTSLERALKESQDRVKHRFAAQQMHVWGNARPLTATEAKKKMKEKKEEEPPLWMYRKLESRGMNVWVDEIRRDRAPLIRANKSPRELAAMAATRATHDAARLDRLYAAAEVRRKMFMSFLDRVTDAKNPSLHFA
jgi:hypothetical protein